ncbi:CDC27 family protein [Abyssogena phaseoliformis symbiont]|uniref:CDC27 family protein n=1 Tax=Abyssogena phaseoliformis symbiont TaxID=596095 RepID=UPI001CEE0033|nr:CDC27 family protein [Abyssogena phaseoliformis symbiont]
MNQTLKFSRLNNINPLVYHLETQNILGFLPQLHFKRQNYQNVIKLEEKILMYWLDANDSLYRYAYALFKQKKYDQALKIVTKLKETSAYRFI